MARFLSVTEQGQSQAERTLSVLQSSFIVSDFAGP